MPHLGHTELMVVVVAAGVHCAYVVIGQNAKMETQKQLLLTSWSAKGFIDMALALDLPLQASTPSDQR